MSETAIATLPDLSELWQQTLGWLPTAEQQIQFQQLYGQVLEGNRQFNLTRITEPSEFWEKHLWDSLQGIRRFLGEPNEFKPDTSLRVIDIGTGAGFPGLPIAIVRPTWTLTLLDSTRKKLRFVDQVIESLSLPNVRTLVDRVEEIGQQPRHRQRYDIALIRAVAVAPVCAEYALPLLTVGGVAVLYRGQWTDEETAALESIAAVLGGEIEAIEAVKTPLTQGDRHCLYLRKVAPTPAEFPRPVGVPTQKPLA